MRWSLSILLTLALLVRAQVPPATRPVESLVHQLGDPDPAARHEASRQLCQIGRPALDALRKATASDEPEVRARAANLIDRIEGRYIPGGPLPERATAQQIRFAMKDGKRVVDLVADNRDITILIGPDSIQVTVTGDEDGQRITQTTTAADPNDLERRNTAAYDIFRRWGGGTGNNWQVGAAQLQVGEGAILINPPVDPLDNLRRRLDRLMADANVLQEHRERVLEQIQRLREAQFGIEKADARLQELVARADALRKTLEDLKLPSDLGMELPPPPQARLGVTLQPVQIGGEQRLTISQVLPGSRAERLGLKPGDLIDRINDKPVFTVQALREHVAAAKGPLVLEIQRNDQAIQLREKEP